MWGCCAACLLLGARTWLTSTPLPTRAWHIGLHLQPCSRTGSRAAAAGCDAGETREAQPDADHGRPGPVLYLAVEGGSLSYVTLYLHVVTFWMLGLHCRPWAQRNVWKWGFSRATPRCALLWRCQRVANFTPLMLVKSGRRWASPSGRPRVWKTRSVT